MWGAILSPPRLDIPMNSKALFQKNSLRHLIFATTVLLLAGCESKVNNDKAYKIVTTLISIDEEGRGSNANWDNIYNDYDFPECYGHESDLSNDGRFVAFSSCGTNFTDEVTTLANRIYLRDTKNNTTVWVSKNRFGLSPDSNPTRFVSISGDGRYVVYNSKDSDMVEGDTNDNFDVFCWDRLTDTTQLVSVKNGTDEEGKIYSGPGSGSGSSSGVISWDGRYVVFSSDFSDLVSGDTNDMRDVFLWDRNEGSTTLISAKDGTEGTPLDGASTLGVASSRAISKDGRYVVFKYAENAHVRDRWNDKTTLVSLTWQGNPGTGIYGGVNISHSGRFVTFISVENNFVPEDTNDLMDAFVADRDVSGNGIFDEPGDVTTIRVSVDSSGNQSSAYKGLYNPDPGFLYGTVDVMKSSLSISGDGKMVVFTAQNLTDTDQTNGSRYDMDPTSDPDIEDWDVYTHNLETGETHLVSIRNTENNERVQAENACWEAVISPDGRSVCFQAISDNLTPGFTSYGGRDIFKRGSD